MRWLACACLASALAAAGCQSRATPEDQRIELAIDLADVLRAEALKISEDKEREKMVRGLVRLREVLAEAPAPSEPPPVLPRPEGGTGPVPKWAQMFEPKSLTIGFFTQTKDFDQVPGDDGLEVRVQPLDQFGDPTKAVGSYRVEVFEYLFRTGEPKGRRLGHWFVPVLNAESNRKYYDAIDRSYVFPLLWASVVPPDIQIIVQVTYYPPGGFEEKIIAQRRLKTGPA